MRTIAISKQTIQRAIERAQSVSEDWTAEICEILLIPAIAKRWQELNPRTLPTLERIPGQSHVGYDRAANCEVGNSNGWAAFAGYILRFAGYNWNTVRADCYQHSSSCAYDGIRRETAVRFAEDLRMLAHGYPSRGETLAAAKIVVR